MNAIQAKRIQKCQKMVHASLLVAEHVGSRRCFRPTISNLIESKDSEVLGQGCDVHMEVRFRTRARRGAVQEHQRLAFTRSDESRLQPIDTDVVGLPELAVIAEDTRALRWEAGCHHGRTPVTGLVRRAIRWRGTLVMIACRSSITALPRFH